MCDPIMEMMFEPLPHTKHTVVMGRSGAPEVIVLTRARLSWMVHKMRLLPLRPVM